MLKQGETVDIISISEDWLEIKQKDEKTGWIASWHTTYENNTIHSNMEVVSKVNHLNIRSGSSTSSEVLATMNAGDEATIVGNEGTWANELNKRNKWMGTY